MSSVRELREECNRMLLMCEGLERVDIHYAESMLRQSLHVLCVEDRKESDYSESQIEQCKHAVELSAIRLEEVLAKFEDEMKQRRDDRRFVEQIYYQLLNKLNWNPCEEYKDFNFVKQLHNHSKQLPFKLTMEDNEKLQKIKTRFVK